jgi:hypothetical protein
MPAPLPPPVIVKSVPDAAKQVALPAAPPGQVILIFPARDQAAWPRLHRLAQLLREAGVDKVEVRPSERRRTSAGVTYFYAEDRGLADKITDALAAADWPGLARNPVAPRLVLTAPAMHPREPGSVDVELP